ncbi:PAS domain S-box protein, partial [Candidatus Poribacteria bacterium]|nr:PAS domain S-box protein [Candidatus Poribacteria bacterium]
MDIIYIIYLLKSISIITVVILAYYSLRNAFFMVGAIGRQIMALGVILFLITDIINSIDLIMFSERKIHIISFIIWFVALSTYTTGGFITGKKLQKAYSSSLIQVSMKHPGSIYVLCGVLILIFFGIPFFLVDIIYHERNTSCWLCIVNSVIWIFAYINLILGASIYYSSGIKSGLNKKETIPIREDIFVARAYSNIINTFLSSTKPITGAFKEAIVDFLEYNPILFENCMINPDGTLELSCIEKNVERIHKENRVNDICLIFSSLGSTLLRVYSAITSQKWAADVLANSFTKVKDIYGETPLMFDILRSFPEEFLQDERFALLPRKELEARIRERTRELEESKNYINNIVRSMTDLLIVVDPDGKIRTTNKATRDLLGFKDGELSGQPVDIIFGSENARRFKNVDFNELILKGSIRYVERNYIHKNGDNVPVLSSYSLMWDEKNDIQGIVCVAQDITERKQAAERERIYLSNIKFLYETTMGFVELPPEDNIYHFIGTKLEELVGDSNIAITSYNEKSDLFKIRCIIGKGKYSQSILKSIEDETEEMYIKVSQEIKDALSWGKIVSYPWYIINEVEITEKVRENLVKFKDEINIHSIGFISEGKLLGSALIIANDNII